MRKERMSIGMDLNLLLLLAMVAANILSFYHLSSTRSFSPSSLLPLLLPRSSRRRRRRPRPAPHHPRHHHPPPAQILLLVVFFAPACRSAAVLGGGPHRIRLLRPPRPPPPLHVLHPLLPLPLRHRAPPPPRKDCLSSDCSLQLGNMKLLPRRRCFSPSPIKPPVRIPADPSTLASSKSPLDLTLTQLLIISRASPIRLALDVGAGAGALAARLKSTANATVLTTTMNLGQPNSEAAAARGVVPMHAPLQQRLPVPDAAADLVRTGHAVNRWIPEAALEFLLMDVDRVLRGGGFLWVDHFFCRGGDLERVYTPMMRRLGYKRIKWAVRNKTDAGGLSTGRST